MDASELARKTIERLKRFTKQLQAGAPIEATAVWQEMTPDGPMTLSRPTVLVPNLMPDGLLTEFFDDDGERFFTATCETTERLMERFYDQRDERPKNKARILAITCAICMHRL